MRRSRVLWLPIILLAAPLFAQPLASKHAGSPPPSPSSPWELARRIQKAYEAHDETQLRALICWDRTDSTIQALTDGYIKQTMQRNVSAVLVKPLTGRDQALALGADSTVYRHNLDHVAYLSIQTRGGPEDRGYNWYCPVGRDSARYLITLWAPTAEQFSLANWNRPPSPREWLDDFLLDTVQMPGTYNFKDSVEAATYYRDLLTLALEDEMAGFKRGASWASLPFWMPPERLLQARVDIMQSMDVDEDDAASGFVALPSVRWTLLIEKNPDRQLQAMSMLQRIRSASADSLILELLTRGHSNAFVLEQALSMATERRIKVPKSVVVRYTQQHRLSIAKAAVALNDQLGYPKVRPADLLTAFHSRPVKNILTSMDSLLVDPLGRDARFVNIIRRTSDSEGNHRADTTRGWVVSDDSSSTVVMTPSGRFETTKPWTDYGYERPSETSITEPGIAREAARIIALRNRTLSKDEFDMEAVFEERTRGSGSPFHDLLIAYRLHQTKQDLLAAEVLLPTLDKLHMDSELLEDAQMKLGNLRGLRMLRYFAGDRDYGSALREAELILSRYPHSQYAAYAKELIRQLPLRKEDFTTLRLPTPEEWAKIRPSMSRQERIRFLCDRLRLMSDRVDTQYAEPPRLDALASRYLGHGKTPVINPLQELHGRAKSDTGFALVGDLTVADLPTLAPYLLSDWFTGEVDIPDFLVHDPGGSYRKMTRTREIVSGLIRPLLPHRICDIDDLDRMSELELRNRVARIIKWAERNQNRERHDQIVDAVLGSESYFEILLLMDYLVEHRVKAVMPKLISFLEAGSAYTNRWSLLSACRQIDSRSSATSARKHLRDTSYMAQFNAGLILYESGDRVDGMLAMLGGLENDNGCFLRAGDPIEDAVSLLLSSRKEDELTVARMAFDTDCFRRSRPADQWPLLRLFTEAGHTDGLEIYLRDLSDSSDVGTTYSGEQAFAMRKNEEVAKFVLTDLAPEQTVKYDYSDSPEKKSKAVESARHWLEGEIAKLKRSRQN